MPGNWHGSAGGKGAEQAEHVLGVYRLELRRGRETNDKMQNISDCCHPRGTRPINSLFAMETASDVAAAQLSAVFLSLSHLLRRQHYCCSAGCSASSVKGPAIQTTRHSSLIRAGQARLSAALP